MPLSLRPFLLLAVASAFTGVAHILSILSPREEQATAGVRMAGGAGSWRRRHSFALQETRQKKSAGGERVTRRR